MNANALRTILGFLAGATFLSMLYSVTGCNFVEATNTVSCEGSWIPIQYQAYVGFGLMVIGGIAKIFRQNNAAGVVANLFKPTVVVDDEKAKPGTVTTAMVNAPQGATVKKVA